MTLTLADELNMSAKIKTGEEALKWAYQLHGAGIQIIRILGSEGQVVTADELPEWGRCGRLGK